MVPSGACSRSIIQRDSEGVEGTALAVCARAGRDEEEKESDDRLSESLRSMGMKVELLWRSIALSTFKSDTVRP